MEVNLSDEKQFGVGAHTAIPYTTSDGTGIIPLGSEPGRVNSLNLQQFIGLGGFLTGVVGPTSSQLQAFGLPISSVSILIQALQSSSDVNVLSTPHILASDNEDAEITVGQNVPFQAGYAPGGSPLTTTTAAGTTAASTVAGFGSLLGGLGSLYAPIQRQNVELRLKIKPQ